MENIPEAQKRLDFDFVETPTLGDVTKAKNIEPLIMEEEVEEDSCGKDEDSTTNEDAKSILYIGMEFESEKETYSFYNDYAKHVGFGIRKRFIRRSKVSNEVISRTYVCSKEGTKCTNKKVDNPRPSTRLGCSAMMKVKRTDNGKWVVKGFKEEHNHELNPQNVRFFRSQRNISTPDKNVIRTLKSSGVQVSKIMSTVIKQSGGIKNVRYTGKDCRNFVDKERRESLLAGDAQVIHDFFVRTQLSDPRFFYSMELDDEQHLRNVFWVDARSRMAYAHFGDVITFDSTYLTNKYSMKFTPFVGVNHHGQSILLGCALVTDETKASFLWVFRTWLTAMQGKPPKAIITDQDQAMKSAISQVFPEARHRLCLWHIMRKIPEKLGSVCKAHEEFVPRFNKCIYDSLTVDEFEERWKKLIDFYELTGHEWLKSLYECRTQWIPVYLKDTFFAGMSTSQRSESINSFFDDYVNRKTCLKEFVDQYDLALHKRYNDEESADFDRHQKVPPLKTGSFYEAQMSSIYTLGMFKKFQDEVLQIPSCTATQHGEDETKLTYLVKELLVKPNGKSGIKVFTVNWNQSTTRISCICRLFEFKGYLCRHAMVVLFSIGVYKIPDHYILKRWTRDAKNMECDDSYLATKDNRSEFMAKCFSDLCADSLKLAEEGYLSKDRYKAVKLIFKEALHKVASMDKLEFGSTDGANVTEGCQTDNMVSKLIVHDPRPSASKGRQTKRIKSGLELSTTKPKRYTCSHCKEKGHTIKTCKQVQLCQKKFVNESDITGLHGSFNHMEQTSMGVDQPICPTMERRDNNDA